ncbi:La protein 1 [Tanacetum coccineum]
MNCAELSISQTPSVCVGSIVTQTPHAADNGTDTTSKSKPLNESYLFPGLFGISNPTPESTSSPFGKWDITGGKKVGRTTELRKPEEVLEQLDSTETLANRKNGSPQEEEYPKGLIVAFKLKTTSAQNDNQVKSGDAKPDSMELETEKETEPKAGAKASSEADEAEEDNKNVVLLEDLKSIFQKFGTVKYIDFKMGQESGYIRFEEADASQKARAAAVLTEEGGLVVKNYVAILDPVTGQDTTPESTTCSPFGNGNISGGEFWPLFGSMPREPWERVYGNCFVWR